jgi:phytoene dehydrogenase-like protein
MKVVVIGAGIGGLSAAIRVAAAGHEVTILEARSDAGGLAGSVAAGGLTFDAGPYVLLDKPGLQWAFAQLEIELPELQRLDDVVYEVTRADAPPVTIYADLDRTATAIDVRWPGTGNRYREFVRHMARTYEKLAPLLRVARPTPLSLLRHGAVTTAPFLMRSLGSVIGSANLPVPVCDALTIWTHVAGQSLATAPSPMAFVPALIHEHGAWVPRGGTSAIARTLRDEALQRGIDIRYGSRVSSILTADGRVTGVETNAGIVRADSIISNHSAVGTYLDLLATTATSKRRKLERLPLQSPGACAYLRVEHGADQPYLRFRLGGEVGCRLLVSGDEKARLIVPMAHQRAQAMGRDGQVRLLDEALAETWWQEGFSRSDVLIRRTPSDWGTSYALYRDSMNVAMTASFMRRGRIAHRSPDVRGLYLAGSSTHPGQWISFCATSGVLAGDALIGDAS